MNHADPRKLGAIVIGGGVAGLVAAAYLARAGKRIVVLEAQAAPAEPIGALDALDPQMVADLELIAHGLRFAQRDLPIVALGDIPLTLGRDIHAATRAIAAVSDADAKAYPPFRRVLLAEARRLRRFWWGGLKEGAPQWILDGKTEKDAFDRLCLTGADAWLGARFESETVVSTLLWDAIAGGFAPSEPGAALALLWRAAGEMAGLQGASALAVPGTLMASLRSAAGSAELRGYARVSHVLAAHGAVRGVQLEDGEILEAPRVLSTLCQADTDALLGRTRAPGPCMGEVGLLLTLSRPMDLAPARYRLGERVEIYLSAHEEARAGRLPTELPLEFVPVDSHHLAVTLRPFPATLPAGWRAQAAAQAIFAIGRHVPGLARAIANIEFRHSTGRAALGQLLAPAGSRLLTGIEGLYRCGDDAEPVRSVSGRAARIAAAFALNS